MVSLSGFSLVLLSGRSSYSLHTLVRSLFDESKLSVEILNLSKKQLSSSTVGVIIRIVCMYHTKLCFMLSFYFHKSFDLGTTSEHISKTWSLPKMDSPLSKNEHIYKLILYFSTAVAVEICFLRVLMPLLLFLIQHNLYQSDGIFNFDLGGFYWTQCKIYVRWTKNNDE